MHPSGDTNVACLISEGELAWCLMYTLLVTQMWPVFFLEGELAWCLMCTFLVRLCVGLVFNVHSAVDMNYDLDLGCELAWFLMWSLLVT